MTDDMLALARANAAEAGVANAEFVKGYIEEIPLPDNTVDVVISNCVINLAADKTCVLRKAARALRPGGRFAVSDVIDDDDMDAVARADMQQWTGCVAGALTRAEYEQALAVARLSTPTSSRPTASMHTRRRRSSALASLSRRRRDRPVTHDAGRGRLGRRDPRRDPRRRRGDRGALQPGHRRAPSHVRDAAARA